MPASSPREARAEIAPHGGGVELAPFGRATRVAAEGDGELYRAGGGALAVRVRPRCGEARPPELALAPPAFEDARALWCARAGALPDGRPFSAGPWHEGVPLPRYVEERALSARERLALFLELCAAVELGHRALLLHGFLDPLRVLVGEDGVPRCADWGLAAAAGEDARPWLDARYAAPERAAGSRSDVRADVYSLGALLRRVVGGEEAARASLPGDLEHVLDRALDPAPEERYASVAALAEDARRFLEGRPLRSRRVGTLARARLALARHRGPALVAAALVALALGGLAASSTLYVRAAEREELHASERAGAEQRASELAAQLAARDAAAERTAAAATASLRWIEAELCARLREARVEAAPALPAELLQAGAEARDARLVARVLLAHALLAERRRGEVDGALERGLELARALHGAGGGSELALLRARGEALAGAAARRAGRPAEAGARYHDVLELVPAELAGSDAAPDPLAGAFALRMEALEALGELARRRGDAAAAAEHLRAARELALAGGDAQASRRWLARTSERLAAELWLAGDAAGAEAELRRAVEVLESLAWQQGEGDPSDGRLGRELASARRALGRLLVDSTREEEAVPLLEASVRALEELPADLRSSAGTRRELAASRQALGHALGLIGRHEEALAQLHGAEAAWRALAEAAPDDAGLEAELARCYALMGMASRELARRHAPDAREHAEHAQRADVWFGRAWRSLASLDERGELDREARELLDALRSLWTPPEEAGEGR